MLIHASTALFLLIHITKFTLALLSFSIRLLLFTHFGETPEAENLFPPIFWHNYKVTAAWATPSPWSILSLFLSSALCFSPS